MKEAQGFKDKETSFWRKHSIAIYKGSNLNYKYKPNFRLKIVSRVKAGYGEGT